MNALIEKIKIAWLSKKLNKLSSSYDAYLSEYNSYYRDLSPVLQKKFRERTYISSQFIDFKPVRFPHVTEEMKILITSALIQITFGLKKFVLRKFKTIYVVPNTYSYGKYPALLGHVDFHQNVIAMSWPSVKEGFIIPNDAINVALHELSHAIQRENYLRLFEFEKFFDDDDLAQWERESFVELQRIRSKSNKYMRKYAGGDLKELFAVSIETFFEQPEQFSQRVPKLYKILVGLLSQNPLNKQHPIKIQ